MYDIRQGGELLDSVVAFDHQVSVRALGMSGDNLVAASRSGTVKVFNVLEFGASTVSRVAGRVLGVHESTSVESSRSAGPELLCHGAEIYTAVDGAVVSWHPDS